MFNYKTAIYEADLAKSYYKELGCEEMFTFSLWGGGHTVSDDDDGYDFIFNSIEV